MVITKRQGTSQMMDRQWHYGSQQSSHMATLYYFLWPLWFALATASASRAAASLSPFDLRSLLLLLTTVTNPNEKCRTSKIPRPCEYPVGMMDLVDDT